MARIYPKPIEELASALNALPGIGPRTAERIALSMLDWDENRLQYVGECIGTLKQRVKNCQICGNLTEDQTCSICTDPARDRTIICVVETARQIPPILKCGHFNGLFHVLGGRLNPLDNIGTEELNIAGLFDRLQSLEVQEIILATSPDVEGEATAVYLAAVISEQFAVATTRIAQGVPLGSDLTFADSATLAIAINSRRAMG